MGGASPLRDSLRNLCADAGWSYAVFWKPIRAADAQLQLVWGDGHCKRMAGAPAISGFEAMDLLLKEKAAALRSGARGEGHVAEGAATRGESRVDTLVNKLMVHQVHVVGEGLIGHAALTGELRWILHDSLDECGSANEVSPEMKQQFWAGIQTIAVIPVLPQGVVQLGSTKMVMEDAALITYVRSLFGRLGSGAGFLPHGALVQNSILKTLIHNSLGASASISCPDAAPGSVNASAFNSDRINHRCLGPQISATMIQSLYHPTPQLYAGATSFCGSETTQNSLNLPLNSDFFQQMVHLDCESNILLKNQLEGQQLKVQLKSDAPDVDSMKGGFSQVSSSSKESNMAILSRRESLSTEKHSCCPRGSTGITKNDNAASSCTRESQVVNKADTLTSQVYSVDCQISNAITVNRRFQAMSIADDTKHEDDSFAISDAPFVRIDQYSNHFQSPLGTLRSDSSTNTISTRQDSSHNAVDKSFCSSETGNSSKDHDLPELLKLPTSLQLSGGSDLFDILRLQQKPRGLNNSEVKDPESVFYGAEQNLKPLVGGSNDDLTGLISETDPDQLLDAIVSKMGSGCRQNLDASMTSNPSAANFDHLSLHSGSHSYTSGSSSGQLFCNLPGVSPMSVKAELPAASFGQSSSSMEKSEGCSQRQQQGYKSQISLWVENSQSMASDSISGQHKRSDEASKSNRKRPRPGENPRPRPKDRQMIQDRIKELREIVPNTAKCSIDALLEKTIKHMLFLQSVAKHADKLKEAGDRKIISQEGGLLLKDNFEGGATWAFEVGSQSMTCPIIVEDLNPPRQMLVEMLCKERGIFLEIADQIRGLGLTILKGVMEVHKDKIWARFAVEANKDVTRMEIFLALVHLLEPSAGSSVLPAGIENISLPRNSFYPSSIPATGFSNCLS